MMACRRFKYCFWILGSVLFFGLTGCNNPRSEAQVFNGEALGTTYQVKFFHTKQLEVESAMDSIFEVINKSMSTYRPDSDISRINSGDTGVIVDQHFREVFQYAHRVFQDSEGYFDPTVGNLVNAYGFGPNTTLDSLDRKQVDSLYQYVGFHKLSLTEDNRIVKQQPEIYLDFNAIAKGYTVDVIAKFLDTKGVKDYLLEIGGELVAKGSNQEKQQAWIVGIDDPLQSSTARKLLAAVKLENRAMATSGNYRKFRVDSLTGQLFVHTIDPLNGQSQKSNLLSVSVLAENCTLADGYATAFMSMGLERSLKVLKRIDAIDVYFIYTDGEEELKTYTTEGFDSALVVD